MHVACHELDGPPTQVVPPDKLCRHNRSPRTVGVRHNESPIAIGGPPIKRMRDRVKAGNFN